MADQDEPVIAYYADAGCPHAWCRADVVSPEYQDTIQSCSFACNRIGSRSRAAARLGV
jgi:hypothetical protein